jgi:hypothetical protein
MVGDHPAAIDHRPARLWKGLAGKREQATQDAQQPVGLDLALHGGTGMPTESLIKIGQDERRFD